MKRNVLIFAFLIFYSSLIKAQDHNSVSQFGAAINFYTGFPQNEFRENIKRNGYGLNLEGYWKPAVKLPFSIGLNIGVLNYGSVTRKEPFSYTIPDVYVNVTNQNNIINYHIVAQLDHRFGILKPYLQLLLGGSYIYTQTKIENQSNQQEIASSTNFEDYAFSTGVGAGMMFRVSKGKPTETGEKTFNELFINLKVSYLFGSNAKYLKEGSIRSAGGGQINYDVLESKTDLFGLHLGVVFTF